MALSPPRARTAAPAALDRVTGQWGALFDSGIVVAAVVAVVLNLVLPGRRGAGAPPSPATVDDAVVGQRPAAG